MQVTISFLPVSLSLLRIPRSRLAKLSQPLLRQILKPNPTFLNITCNELELSVFAERDVVDDFEAIARKDRQKLMHVRAGRGAGGASGRRGSVEEGDHEYVEISYDTWNVLQIDSHSDGLDNSGARIHELSAPLAEAGISILYLSSYMSDFIFVKSTRLHQVVGLMQAAGFDLYASDPSHLTPHLSPVPSPTRTFVDDSSLVFDLRQDTNPGTLSGPRSYADSTSLTSILLGSSRGASPTRDPSESESDVPVGARSKSHSPSASHVTVLRPDLTCVGLSDDSADIWALKIIKLVAFPEMIPPPPRGPTVRKNSSSSYSSSLYSQPRSPLFDFDSPTSNEMMAPVLSSELSSDGELTDDGDDHCAGQKTGVSKRTISRRAAPDLSMSSIVNASSGTMAKSPTRTHARRVSDSGRPAERFAVPFYSFTRTTEGSSLTTDVTLLAALFPAKERHMVICSDELDKVGELDDDDADADDRSPDQVPLSGTLKCLQIDLRNFGLDKHGLVNSYSKILQENGINHMYSSTYKTANLLVDKMHVRRAQELLRYC